MTSQKNLSIDTSFDMVSNARGSACTVVVKYSRYYSLGNKCLCGDHGSIASHNVSTRRSLPRYIYTSLIVVYSYGASVVSNEVTGREQQFQPHMLWMLMQFVSLHGPVGMRRIRLFYLSRWFLMIIWVKWLLSCGRFKVLRILIIMTGACTSKICFTDAPDTPGK